MGIGKKSQSKRLTCRKKYKIAKLVRAHNKKLKRKTDSSVTKRRKSKKDPGIPNRFPFKEEILKEAEKRKLEKEEERQKQAEKRKKERQKVVDKKRNLETLAKDAKKRAEDFDRKARFVKEKAKDQAGAGKAVENSLKAYYREVKKVIEGADVIIEVLDARDPLGSRCPQVEEAVLSHGPTKRLILLLNKIDLVPKENVEKWLKYLRNEFPVLPFKASTQAQSDKLSHSKVPLALASDDLRKSSCCLGADTLLTLLGNYCHSQAIKTSITIGIVGFPNTGKSSIINSLKRCKACNVGPTPGLTKIMQIVQLDKHIRLLDSPGVVMATNMADDAAVVLRNCVRVESLEDPVPAVSVVVSRCHKQQLMLHYGIADFSNITDFLALLAKRRGLLKKAGRPDVNKAAKLVLQDWNVGRITYYCEPPETYTRSSHVTAEIVTEMCKAFDIDALLSQEKETLKELKPTNLLTDIVMPSQGPTAGRLGDDGDATDAPAADDAEMSEEEEEGSDVEDGDESMEDDAAPAQNVTVDLPKSKKKAKNATKAAAAKPAPPAGNMQMNRQRKMDFKKLKKQRRRADNLAGDLSSALTSGLLGLGSQDEEYSFAADFK